MISRVSLVITDGGDAPTCGERLRAEFPTVHVEATRAPSDDAVAIAAREWRDASAFDPFDRAMRSVGQAVAVCGSAKDIDASALEILTRYQRFVGRRNGGSSGRDFERLLALHLRAHDTRKPLVLADWDHALDTWQWMLRLEPEASAAAQIAALLHDIERLVSESDARVEHEAVDYQAFKDAHARAGAAMARDLLARAEIDGATAARVELLIANHEKPADDAELRLLNDADALSFFSLNSEGYLRYFGPAQARRKVAYTFARLGARHRPRLREIRLPPEIAREVGRELERCGA